VGAFPVAYARRMLEPSPAVPRTPLAGLADPARLRPSLRYRFSPLEELQDHAFNARWLLLRLQ
jgi:hypothetical protein